MTAKSISEVKPSNKRGAHQYKPVNMNRSYKYSLFFVGTVCKMYFTSVYPGIKDQEYRSTEKFKRTGMLLHKKTAPHKMGSLSDSDRIHSMQHHKITSKSYNIIYQRLTKGKCCNKSHPYCIKSCFGCAILLNLHNGIRKIWRE